MLRFAHAPLAVVALTLAACGNPLYSPCNGQVDCASGLRCIDLGADQQICTKPCTTTKGAAGYPDGFDNAELYVDGSGARSDVPTPQCADQPVAVTSSDNPDEGSQNLLVESAGVIGVCQIAPVLLEDDAINNDSILIGYCAPR